MTSPTQNVLIAAVGGQGALLAARVIGRYAVGRGLEVKVSEIHGMSQRGGSVVTHVRFGPRVHSPVIERGAADTLIAFEMLEALRHLPALRPGGTLIVNTQQIPPLPVSIGAASYPDGLEHVFASRDLTAVQVDGRALALKAGNEKAVNVVLLGVYAGRMGCDQESWLPALEASVPPKHLATNMAAFAEGLAAAAAPSRPPEAHPNGTPGAGGRAVRVEER